MKRIFSYLAILVLLVIAVAGIRSVEAADYSISTLFAGGNGNEGEAFNFESVDGNTYIMTGMDVQMGETGATTLDILYREGGYVGFVTTPGAWTLLDSVAISATSGATSFVDFADLTINPGTVYGIAIISQVSSVNVAYTNGSNAYNDTRVELNTGSGINEFFLGENVGREANVTVYYSDPVVPVTILNVPHVTDIRINAWQQVVAYDSPAGSPAKLLSGAVIVLPHDSNGDGYDTYVVTDTAVVDGVTWYSIFLGNESFVWVNGSEVTLQ